jgi:hypothetical protein
MVAFVLAILGNANRVVVALAQPTAGRGAVHLVARSDWTVGRVQAMTNRAYEETAHREAGRDDYLLTGRLAHGLQRSESFHRDRSGALERNAVHGLGIDRRLVRPSGPADLWAARGDVDIHLGPGVAIPVMLRVPPRWFRVSAGERVLHRMLGWGCSAGY